MCFLCLVSRLWSCSEVKKFNNPKNFPDIDECSDFNGGCSHHCINHRGGYECSCREGFALRADGATCEDVNECLTANCTHFCTNTPGSYRCGCTAGYGLDMDGVTCRGKLIAASV